MLYQHHFGYVLQKGYRKTQIYFFIKIPALLNFATIGFPYSQAKRAGILKKKFCCYGIDKGWMFLKVKIKDMWSWQKSHDAP